MPTARFAPGNSTLEESARKELDRVAAIVAKSPDAKLGLMAEIVSADLEAMGSREKRPNFFRRLFRGKQGAEGGAQLESQMSAQASELATARLKAASDYVVAAGTLSAARVTRAEWDEQILEGTPRVVLRFDQPDDEGE